MDYTIEELVKLIDIEANKGKLRKWLTSHVHAQTSKHQSGQILRERYRPNLKMPLFADILQLQVNSKGGLEYQNALVQQSRALQEPREHRDKTGFLTKQLAKYLEHKGFVWPISRSVVAMNARNCLENIWSSRCKFS